jgi:hypothetical protein
MRRILLAALIAGVCFAQTASVYELSGDDAAEGRKLYQAKLIADIDYKSWADHISEKYGKKESNSPTINGVTFYGSYIDAPDLDFSPDFRFAVPKQHQPAIDLCKGQYLLGCGASVSVAAPAISY